MARFIEMKSKCRLCGCPITLKSDSGCPPELADQLAPMVVCDRCADFRSATRVVESKLGSLSRQLLIGRVGKERVQEEKRAREAFTLYTKQYCRAMAAFYRDPALAWHQDFVELLMENPDKWAEILTKIRASFRQASKQPTKEQNARPTTEQGSSPGPSYQPDL